MKYTDWTPEQRRRHVTAPFQALGVHYHGSKSSSGHTKWRYDIPTRGHRVNARPAGDIDYDVAAWMEGIDGVFHR